MNIQTLVFRYVFFAVLATLANLTTQRGVLLLGDSSKLFALALVAGTVVGLVLKYILDKRWIFDDMSVGFKAHRKRFSLYTAMGLFTTAIFWSMETVFWLVWQTDAMRELGAMLGLSIGYVVKYKLDRRFVFTDTELVQAS